MNFLYDCGFVLADADGNPIPLEDAIAFCQDGDPFAACAAGCGVTSNDCTELESCVVDNCV